MLSHSIPTLVYRALQSPGPHSHPQPHLRLSSPYRMCSRHNGLLSVLEHVGHVLPQGLCACLLSHSDLSALTICFLLIL